MPLKDTKIVGLEVPGAAALLRPGPLAQGVRPGQARGTSPQDQVSPQLPEIDESAYPLLGHLWGHSDRLHVTGGPRDAQRSLTPAVRRRADKPDLDRRAS